MVFVFLSWFQRPVGSQRSRGIATGVALILLLGALLSPWGMARSHGSAAFTLLDQVELGSLEVGHGHSHEDDEPSHETSHAHHAGDHSHDHAHALPVRFAGMPEIAAIWLERRVYPGPRLSPDGLERPPRS